MSTTPLPMRLTYLSASEIPSRAANTVHVMKMCAAFAGEGHDVELWARKGQRFSPDVFADFGVAAAFQIRFARWPRLPLGLAGGAFALHVLACMRASRPDLVYGRHLPSVFGLACLGLPVALEMHSPPEDALRERLIRALLRMPRFRGIVVISEALARDYLARFPEAQGAILVAHDGADATPSAGPRPSRAPGARTQVGYVGHLYAGRGVELILTLAAAMPTFDFHLVGGSEAHVQQWAERAAGRSNVRFHGYVRHAELGRHYTGFDILIAPYQQRVTVAGGGGDTSRWMSPLKLFEYMAQRTPAVVSDLQVLREVVRHDQTALLCPPDDALAWQSALERLSQDANLAQRLSAAAYEEFERRYTWRARAKLILDFLARPAAEGPLPG